VGYCVGCGVLIIRVVTVHVAGRKVTVTGPRGTLNKDFGHTLVDITYYPKKHQITVDVWFGNKLEKSCIKSVCTHIKNMFTGVTKVYTSTTLSSCIVFLHMFVSHGPPFFLLLIKCIFPLYPTFFAYSPYCTHTSSSLFWTFSSHYYASTLLPYYHTSLTQRI
jgi:hypothetical protein